MKFPKWKKRLKGLLSSGVRIISTSKNIALSAGLLALASGQPAGQPKIPADPKQVSQDTKITKYSTKYLLRAAGRFTTLFAQHRSHASHSSHSSHYSSSRSPGHSSHNSHSSHVSHYSSSPPAPAPEPSHSSHTSHYSSSGQTLATPPNQPSNSAAPARGARPVYGFRDNFDSRAQGSTRWIPGALNAEDSSLDTQIIVLQRNNRLEIVPRANVAGRHFNGYISVAEWDMKDAAASVEVGQTAENTADTVFAIGVDSNNWYGFVVEDGKLYFQSKVKGVKSPKIIPYNATQHKFWRFRINSTANTITWETSRDRVSWELQREETVQMDISAVRVSLGAGTYQTVSAPGAAAFTNFVLER